MADAMIARALGKPSGCQQSAFSYQQSERPLLVPKLLVGNRPAVATEP